VIGITDAQLAGLRQLAPALEAETYLAGGVAIAMAYGHRTSRDLDLFVPRDFEPERLEERLAASPSDIRVTGRARGTLHLELGPVPVSILSYRYPLLAPTERRSEIPIPVASLEDLACMKVSAIAGRGAAKDFWDLYVLLEHGVAEGRVESVLVSYARKFPIEDIGHAVRSMAYFADADASPLPIGLSPVLWGEIKRKFAAWIRAL
jgi:Nucleotidyl transferase AbiEii toxin, Type IV TA system